MINNIIINSGKNGIKAILLNLKQNREENILQNTVNESFNLLITFLYDKSYYF